jgi:hypothetical protein
MEQALGGFQNKQTLTWPPLHMAVLSYTIITKDVVPDSAA